MRQKPPTKPSLQPEATSVQRRCHAAAALTAVVLLMLVGLLSTTHVLWSTDSFTDMNILMAGENFATHGLLNLHLLPVHYITPKTASPIYYLHYPPLPDLLNGVLRIIGINRLAVMRCFCGTLCVVGLVCMYLAFGPVIGPVAAVCGLAFAGTSGFFLAYAISLHHAYNVFGVGLFLLLFMRALRGEHPARGAWAGAWAVLLFASLTSFEFILYPQIFAWTYVIGTGQLRRHWRWLLFLGTAPVVAVGLHFLQNCWAVGLSPVLADGFGYGEYQENGRWFWLKQLPDTLLARSQRSFYWPWPVLLLVGAVWLVAFERRQPEVEPRRRAGALVLGVVFASMGWYLFMPRHAVIHSHCTNQLLPLAFVVMGCTTALIGRWLLQRSSLTSHRLLAALALLVLVTGQARTTAWRLGEWKPGVSAVFEAIGPDALPPKAAVLANVGLEADFAYFMRRPAWRTPRYDRPFPECLLELRRHLPDDWQLRYYMFFGGPDAEPFKLLASTCPGRRLVVPQMKSVWVVLFDVAQLHLPPDQRAPLPPDQRQRQLAGQFPPWELPGFETRLKQILSRYPGWKSSK